MNGEWRTGSIDDSLLIEKNLIEFWRFKLFRLVDCDEMFDEV